MASEPLPLNKSPNLTSKNRSDGRHSKKPLQKQQPPSGAYPKSGCDAATRGVLGTRNSMMATSTRHQRKNINIERAFYFQYPFWYMENFQFIPYQRISAKKKWRVFYFKITTNRGSPFPINPGCNCSRRGGGIQRERQAQNLS
jgi:hypothetical protein